MKHETLLIKNKNLREVLLNIVNACESRNSKKLKNNIDLAKELLGLFKDKRSGGIEI